jgi:CheY-like chemotaxis protein
VTWILLLDDDRDLTRAMGRLIVRRIGTRVREAHDPSSAIETLAVEPVAPAAAILDHDLRDDRADGVTVLTELRRRWPLTPCAFYTGTPPDELEAQLAEAGVDAPVPHFHKPTPVGPLMEWLQSAIACNTP